MCAYTRVEAYARDNLAGIETFHLCIGVKFVEIAYAQSQICIGKEFYRLCLLQSHYQHRNIALECARLQHDSKCSCRSFELVEVGKLSDGRILLGALLSVQQLWYAG